MEKENKMAAFKAGESKRYGDYAVVGNGKNYGILDTVTGNMVLELAEYGSNYDSIFSHGYIIITNDCLDSKITIFDTEKREIVVENYTLSNRDADVFIVQNPETGKYYQINIEKLREEGLQGPYDRIEFVLGMWDTLMPVTAAFAGEKMALYSPLNRITDFDIKEATAYETIIICTDSKDKKFFMPVLGTYCYKKSPRFDSITVGKTEESGNKTPILTCKTGDTIKIYAPLESDKPIFSMRCDSATVVGTHDIASGVNLYVILYAKDGLEGLSIARVRAGNVKIDDIVPAKRNIKIETSPYVIGGRVLNNDLGTAVAKGNVANGVGMSINAVLSAGRYYYGVKDGKQCIAEINGNNVKIVKAFDDETLEDSGLIDRNFNNAIFISSKDGKKIITTVQEDEIRRSKMYDDITPLTNECLNEYFYFIGTIEGKKVLLANGSEVPFKCYDQNTGMESTELSSDKIIFTKGLIGSAVILNQRALSLPQQKLDQIVNVTFGEKSFVAEFADSTVVADYDAKPLIQFLEKKTLTPNMVNLGDTECELYQDENCNWYGPSGNVSEPTEYFVSNAALIEKGTRMHLTNPEVAG